MLRDVRVTPMPRRFFFPADRPWLNLLLFALTLVTTTTTFQTLFGGELSLDANWAPAVTFSLSVVAILGTHEFGHYALARWHGVETSLPYFIPLPFLGVGTLGAVIRMRSRIPTRNALVDIGAAGPLAGIAVALPVLWWGLAHSTVVDVGGAVTKVGFLGENSLWSLVAELGQFLTHLVSGGERAVPPEPTRFVFYFGDSLLLRGLEWLVLGPLPDGKDVSVHPMVIAGWFGILVTMLNLMPIGQLDGGHLAFALFGEKAKHVGHVAALGLFSLCLFFSASWALWLIVAWRVIGFRHPDVVVTDEPLSTGRKLICLLCAVVLILCVMPVPLAVVDLP